MTPDLCEEALRGLRLIHNAHVLHRDTELRNLLIYPGEKRAIWIDFSIAEVDIDLWEVIDEREEVRMRLYIHLV